MPERVEDRSKESIDNLINAGSEIIAGAAGDVIGFLIGGLIGGTGGAAIGGAAAPIIGLTFSKVAKEIKARLLGHREEVRIGATFTYAVVKIRENITNGQQIRQDGFFQEQPDQRAAAEEILEGILLVAQREHEEKKLLFYANLVANIAFHPEISRAEANLLIRLGERLSYRQICLLKLFMDKNRFRLRQENYRNFGNLGEARVSLLQEIYDLYSQRIIDIRLDLVFGQTLPYLEDIIPGQLNVQAIGTRLYHLMELSRIESEDLQQIATLLSV